MAYSQLYNRWSPEWIYIADDDDDVEDIADEHPEAPVGTWVIAGADSGPANIYIKLPSGEYTLLVGESS